MRRTDSPYRPAEGAAPSVGESISADLLDGLAIGFFRSTRDGRILAANRAFREIFGFPDDRALLGGAAVSLYADPDDRRRAVLQLERDGTIHGFEARLRRFDGSLFWGKFSSRVLRDSAGRALFYEGAVEDVTESKRAEHALRESEERFRELAESIDDGFWIADPHADRMLYVSPGLERMWGRPAGATSWDRATWLESIHPDDRALVEKAARSLGKSPGEILYRIVRPDGAVRWIRGRAKPIRDELGGVARIAGVVQDVTTLKETEDALRALSHHGQMVRESEDARISREIHDQLGQSLTSLKMDLAWIRDQVRRRSTAASVGKKIESMTGVVDSTIEAVRRIAAELRPTILDELGLSAAVEWQAKEFQKRTGIRCRVRSVPPDVVTDRDRSTALFRILQEALTNVARHAKATVVHVALQAPNGSVEMKVSDNGRGIPPNEASNPKALGLLGMRERAWMLGGKLEVRRMQKGGTEVVVEIPLEEAGPKAAPQP